MILSTIIYFTTKDTMEALSSVNTNQSPTSISNLLPLFTAPPIDRRAVHDAARRS